MNLKFYPLTPPRWEDFEKLFGENGACGGCWCMWWRLKRSEYQKNRGKKNKKSIKKIVDSGEIPGIIAYLDDKPIAWCSIAPRENFPTLENSRILKRVDDKQVWSIVCFFVARPFRHKGITLKILKASLEYAKKKGAKIIEGYPVEPRNENIADAFAWTGFASAFRKAGFKEITRRSEIRPIMRYFIKKSTKKVVRKGGQISGQKKKIMFTKRQKQILRLIQKNPIISRRQLSLKLKINQSAIQKHLENLKEKKVLRRIGPDKGGYWKIKWR